VKLLSISTHALLRLLGVKDNGGNAVTEEEIHAMLAEGTTAGVIESHEHTMVRNVFRLGAWAAEICRVQMLDRLPAQGAGFGGPVVSCGRGDAHRAWQAPMSHAVGVRFAHLATLTPPSCRPCAAGSAPGRRA
jgi:hypothetical protein